MQLRSLAVRDSLSKILVYLLHNLFRCRKKREIKNPNVLRTKNGGIIILSKCGVAYIQKSKFVKEEKATTMGKIYKTNYSFHGK